MNRLHIILHNSKVQIAADRRDVLELREMKDFKLMTPGFFHMQRMGKTHGWDGNKRYITESGLMQTGLLPKLLSVLQREKIPYYVEDKRYLFRDKEDITHVGDFELRPYQKEAVVDFINNKLRINREEIRWQRGILSEATNAGKNLIAAAIFSSFSTKRNGLFLINNKTIFNQAVKEITQLLGKDIVGQVSSVKTDWKRFNICMVQTLANRIKKIPQIKRDLANNDILIVDEGDEVIGRKDTMFILDHAHNAPVRVSLTGTTGLSKNKIKNLNEEAFFGPVVHITKNKQLVDQGYSAKPIIKIHTGNTSNIEGIPWAEEYSKCIVKSKKRNARIWKRVRYNAKRGRLPILVLFKLHSHVKYLRVAVAHGKVKNREQILAKFREDKIDILLCSMIIRRGKNLPSMQTLINAAGGDSHANALQILGRGLRMGETKTKIYFEDFFDQGKHLRRHSKHRIAYYKREEFEVKELYKTKK